MRQCTFCQISSLQKLLQYSFNRSQSTSAFCVALLSPWLRRLPIERNASHSAIFSAALFVPFFTAEFDAACRTEAWNGPSGCRQFDCGLSLSLSSFFLLHCLAPELPACSVLCPTKGLSYTMEKFRWGHTRLAVLSHHTAFVCPPSFGVPLLSVSIAVQRSSSQDARLSTQD
jgi:hypothetical protein